MKRLSLLIAAGGIVMACAGEEPTVPLAPPPPPATPLPTYVVFGTVQDEAGAPLSGAVADLVGLGRTSISNESGYFSFTGVRGPMTVRVGKDGYEPQTRNLNVTADLAFSVKLSRVLLSEEIVLGQTIRSTVNESAPPCDPIRWDAMAPCRRFGFTAPFSGVFVVSISWNGGIPLDATMMNPDDTYLASSRDSGFGQITLVATVYSGVRYELRVNSYYGRQEFDLKADLTP